MSRIRENLFFENEPVSWTDTDKESVRNLFAWAAENKANDINISTGSKIAIQKDGILYKVTNKVLNDDDVKNILYVMYETDAARAELLSGKDKDFRFFVKSKEGKKYGFRVNATAILSRDTSGIQITSRVINPMPPRISDFDIEEEILNNYIRDEGMVLVTGSTGTGKSTLLAALIRGILEDPNSNKKILTYEAPIEFVYENVISDSSIIYQTEVYRQLPDFSSAVRNALRRAPDIILIGESRDAETIKQSVLAAKSGHLLLTTAHTNGVSEAVKRMISEFDKEEKHSMTADIISSMNMIVSQKLLPKVGGGRVAIREYLVFTEEIKRELLTAEPDNISYFVRLMLQKHGQTFYQAAQIKYEQGLISEHELKRLEYLDTAENKDRGTHK